MRDVSKTIGSVARLVGEVAAETLWPTRCALCDVPGDVLCPRCRNGLPYLDWWRACKRCGSPFGAVQCDLCNPVGLGRIGREELPFAGCASATIFSDETGRLVRVYKDLGEQRLAEDLAMLMVPVVPPGWEFDCVTFAPATKAAFRRRGFDHAELLARAVATRLEVPCIAALKRPRTRDQRSLGASARVTNLSHAFETVPRMACGQRLLLVDDVMTTGATLCAATDALLADGAHQVHCLTFARV